MSSPTPLKFLMPGWFSLVMGLCGLSLAWHRAAPLLGDMAEGLALVAGLLALGVFLVLLGASLLRWQRHPAALAEDLKHPVRHAFVAAFPVSLLLLATVGVALGGASGAPSVLWRALWWAGSLLQLWATLWVLGRWLVPAVGATPGNTGLWPSVTPVLLIPVVGNVLAPLAGVPLGHGGWAAAQFGIGAFFWPLVLALVLARRITHSPLPDRLLPAWMITVAPPAVIGLVLSQLVERGEAPLWAVQALWGVALFFLLWVLPVLKRAVAQPFGIPFWGLSFPLAAFTTLTLRLLGLQEPAGGLLQTGAVLLLAATSMVVLWLGFATVRGLRDGSLLAPEPVASITPVAA
ncbi:SLAC1 anion channel family protein [Hydrogenophaga pseudoflava]|uniref:SLAC1 anion channel family protein n=1 Tax=Hydrogenophaga pseudoflava TaxID=47421 RepID=UPI0027E3FC7C|nr:SLAC1 anion channel family protein [Hydrogenophaga pseudoflava]MDQ7746056.1 SLAC1 anion channel family protein [Hydrogenophaga pseudoflava]